MHAFLWCERIDYSMEERHRPPQARPRESHVGLFELLTRTRDFVSFIGCRAYINMEHTAKESRTIPLLTILLERHVHGHPQWKTMATMDRLWSAGLSWRLLQSHFNVPLFSRHPSISLSLASCDPGLEIACGMKMDGKNPALMVNG